MQTTLSRLLRGLLAAGLAAGIQWAHAAPIDDAFDAKLQALKAINATLTQITDANSAKAATATLDQAIGRNQVAGKALTAELQKLGKPSEAVQNALTAKFAEMQALNAQIAAAQERFQKLPGVPQVVGHRVQQALE